MPHGIYPSKLAEDLKECTGQKWRPSNGTEGEIFTHSWCRKCKKDAKHDCKILAATLAFNVAENGYPAEWQYGNDGQPMCAGFEA